MADSTFWSSVISTLIGAASGSGLSGVIGWKIYKREELSRRQTSERNFELKYEERLTDELIKLAEKIQEFLYEVPIELDDIGREKMALGSSLDIAAMKAKGQDLELVRLMADAAYDMGIDTSEKHQRLVWDLITSLSAWRTKVYPIEFYLSKFKRPYQLPTPPGVTAAGA